MQIKTLVIDSRFNGPPDSGNGGYVAGLLAKELGQSATVSLRRPPPLNTSLQLEVESTSVVLKDGEHLVAMAEPCELEIEVPACPPSENIERVAANYISAAEHVFSTCFVCGPDRRPEDGLNIFPVATPEHHCVASLWQPAETLPTENGHLATEIIWAALDCPGYFAHQTSKMMLLGSISATIKRYPVIGESLISIGWQSRIEGRKYFSGTALYDQDGAVCAASQQLWIAPK